MTTSPRFATDAFRTLAIMGMSKNTGKTVALNHLLAQAAQDGVSVGVTSIGRDGEERDQVFFVPKPPVRVWSGTLVATARATLARAKARCEFIDNTGIASAMGEIVIVKTLEHGEMEIAGASRGSDQCQVIARLQQCGATQVLLDGALGRSQHASPTIADAVILATGAALGGGVPDVLRKTRERLAILGTAVVDSSTKAHVAPLFARGGVALWDHAGKLLFQEPIATLNAGAVLLQHCEAELGTIALSGAVGRLLWQALMTLAARHPCLTVVVADGTRLFVENSDLLAFEQLGGRLLAWQAIKVAGITLNPYSPMGGSFAADEFLAAARLAFAGYVVRDVMLEPVIAGPDPQSIGQVAMDAGLSPT